ncbi:uncharacterized protein BHQ10_001481 [Talaromyces amestolkiae]|uniref:Uncharacterized protein n=1 Tax=Talaromyces amestolkiae TaxID=1196081 RepID=A0A364KPL0_TALAM|nr:uncharacterized protein BHQ10_001481 [Talaromyces amestolkiae]RAO65469.1 hypothetical protein BHQ10_001481 [Talaromyces amestolkiae]
MGSVCSKSANKSDDTFSQPGRVLGSSAASGTPNQPARAAVPGNVVSQGPGRTLGGASSPQDTADARAKAAEAAQKRAEALNASSKGKLGSQLAAQKARTQTQTLGAASQAEVAARNADSAAETRQWN